MSAAPSGAPSEYPSEAPIIPPSAAPSLTDLVEVVSEYTQQLTVTENFSKEQVERFCRIYTRYTLKFGYNLGEPQIYTKCTVHSQLIGYTRRKLTFWNMLRRVLQEETPKETTNSVLTMNFFMKYSTRIGVYDLTNYNTLFTQYVNSNTTKVLQDMSTLQLPVLNVSNVIELEDISPTNEPTFAPQTEAPVPRSQAPSAATSMIASPPVIPEPGPPSFKMGLSLGLVGAFAVAAIGFVYYRHIEKQKRKDELIKRELSGDNNDIDNAGNAEGMGDSMEVKVSNHNGVPSQEDIINDGVSDNIDVSGQGIGRDTNASVLLQPSPPRIGSAYDIESGPPLNATVSSSAGSAPAVHPNSYATMDSLFSQQVSQAQSHYQDSFQSGAATNFMMADASFSSDSEDELVNPSAFDGSYDELDNYKNNDLEILRDAVEEAVEDVEGMLSLAMTQALTESDEAELPWGSEDSGSIEASCLFETYDWLKRNEESPLDTRLVGRLSLFVLIHVASSDKCLHFVDYISTLRNDFFQEVINNTVITVLFGLMHPLEAAQLAHGVATVIGLPLLKELPKKTLVITGMRKTTDVDRGQPFILSAFERFGPIESAAIAPNNRGFGFVRFSKPKSVQKALERYRVAEIEIQNVSVSIKTLENTTTARE